MPHVLYADVETASADYASRFSGAAGEWLLSVQSKIFIRELQSVLNGTDRISLLDVGGGHAQLVEAISGAGLLPRCNVTVLGSGDACQERLKPFIARGECTFKEGDLLSLPFPDRSFDVVTSFRFIPHCEEWKRHIGELCRVAKRAVIVDYPAYCSVNCLSPLLFRLKKKVERNTRTYTLFSHGQIREAFGAANFKIAAQRGEFVLPMVVHRMIKNGAVSSVLESPFKILDLANLLGSPVIVRAVPKDV